MNDKNYDASCLLYLFESAGMAGTPEAIPQENIADSGEDVNGEMNPEMDDQSNTLTDENTPIDPQMEDQVPPSESSEENIILEKEKFKKLFNLFEDLITYGEVFTDNIKYIDTNLLDETIFVTLRKYFENIKLLNKKMKSYLINFFNNEPYEKVLYAYILFRTELITAIKGIRRLLVLDNPDKNIK